ncbi:glycine--tRNA ligase subunit beta [Novosphingobium sp. MD-1]|uniref:glycine--tRNA ligase subunit beta n=1 Tax=Novosphingobium sp. MD-1 TaxID=1630648 RepID=UPI00061C12E7|nr:glycine--tRNA ligase subunit beta [Novosphingobium sp. MD-1]GAO56447.1 glycyl-tRNA synthetase beta chain [Novosphingobium sp. MD-1]
MPDFLLELRCEEIPARMQAGARASLEKLFRDHLAAAGLSVGDLTIWTTPRRLALIARGLPAATEAVSEEVKGPRTSAPEQALEGFLRKTGLTKDQLTERDGVWFAVSEKPGRATADVLAEAIPAIVRAFPWPKSQRWGAASLSTESLRWVRPLSAIVALLDGEVVDCEVGGIRAGRITRGHRFHAPGEITIDGVGDYAAKLRDAHVLVDHAEREAIVRDQARAVASAAGLTLVEDEGLVVENAGLTEWPVPLLGRFDAEYLEVPPEVIQLTARTNQKYFICRDADGKLANAFVCTANIVPSDGGAEIVAGNRKVLAARLSDARFFWQQDRKVPLSVHAEKLQRITFHEKLGTVADKVERVAKLARWLVEEGIVQESPLPHAGEAGGGPDETPAQSRPTPNPSREREGSLADQAELAARLCKADLVTEMVGEFPELQGLMGGYYARAEGLPDAVADAIRDHYKPVGQGDDVPTAPVTVAVALADKLDTLFAFEAIQQRPTGSKDPFALRRNGYSLLSIWLKHGLRRINEASDFIGMYLIKKGGDHVQEVEAWLDEHYQFEIEELYNSVREATLENDEVKAFFANKKISEISSEKEQALAQARAKAQEIQNFAISYQGAFYFAKDFLIDRLKVQQREAGVRHDLIDAVFALGGEDDLVRLLARVHALQAFIGTEDGANLLAGYKRAANILKKEGFSAADIIPPDGEEDPLVMVDDPAFEGIADQMAHSPTVLAYTPEPAEQALIEALAVASPRAEAAVAAEDFTGAMAALATLRAPIDSFFETVTVNDADANKRANRLGLLDRFRAAVHKVADFGRIEG